MFKNEINNVNTVQPVDLNAQQTAYNNQNFQNALPDNKLYSKRKDKKLYDFFKGDFICLSVISVIMFTVIRLGAFNGFNFGFTLSGFLLLLSSFIYLFNKGADNKIFNLLLFVFGIALLSVFSLSNDDLLKFLCAVFLVFVYILMVCGISGNSKDDEGTYIYVFDVIKKSFVATFTNISLPFLSIKKTAKEGKANTAVSLLVGIGVAVPLLCIILPLLATSDIAFGNMIDHIFKDIAIIIAAVVLTIAFIPFVFSHLFSLKKSDVREKGIKFKGEGKIQKLLVNTTLSAVSVVYLVYIFSQLAYISDAFSFLLPENYTAAEFARSGFFQMAVIAFINCIIIAVGSTVVKKELSHKLPVVTKILLTFLCCFTIFYISTAFIKMMKYISLYGLTRLRVLTSVFMLMIAVIFVVILIKLFVVKFRYIKVVISVCAVTLIAVSAVDINTIIAEYNYNAYKADKIEIDIEQISGLGVSSIPTLVKLAEDENKEIAYFAIDELIWVATDIYENAFNKVHIEDVGLIPVKTSVFEKNYVWNNSKEALDAYIKKHPEIDKLTFTDWYYYDYLTDSDDSESSDDVIGGAEITESIIVD